MLPSPRRENLSCRQRVTQEGAGIRFFLDLGYFSLFLSLLRIGLDLMHAMSEKQTDRMRRYNPSINIIHRGDHIICHCAIVCLVTSNP